MKHISWPLLLTIPLIVMAMSPVFASSSSETEPFRVYRHTLPNGLRVRLQPRSDSPPATAFLVVRAGSRWAAGPLLLELHQNTRKRNYEAIPTQFRRNSSESAEPASTYPERRSIWSIVDPKR